MPKKTKQEKILASYRRQIKLLKNNADNSQTTISSSTSQSQSLLTKNNKSTVSNPTPIIDIYKPIRDEKTAITKKFFLSDLKKSLLIIGLIVLIEVGLYITRIIK